MECNAKQNATYVVQFRFCEKRTEKTNLQYAILKDRYCRRNQNDASPFSLARNLHRITKSISTSHGGKRSPQSNTPRLQSAQNPSLKTTC